jgi:hypothetical protein
MKMPTLAPTPPSSLCPLELMKCERQRNVQWKDQRGRREEHVERVGQGGRRGGGGKRAETVEGEGRERRALSPTDGPTPTDEEERGDIKKLLYAGAPAYIGTKIEAAALGASTLPCLAPRPGSQGLLCLI